MPRSSSWAARDTAWGRDRRCVSVTYRCRLAAKRHSPRLGPGICSCSRTLSTSSQSPASTCRPGVVSVTKMKQFSLEDGWSWQQQHGGKGAAPQSAAWRLQDCAAAAPTRPRARPRSCCSPLIAAPVVDRGHEGTEAARQQLQQGMWKGAGRFQWGQGGDQIQKEVNVSSMHLNDYAGVICLRPRKVVPAAATTAGAALHVRMCDSGTRTRRRCHIPHAREDTEVVPVPHVILQSRNNETHVLLPLWSHSHKRNKSSVVRDSLVYPQIDSKKIHCDSE